MGDRNYRAYSGGELHNLENRANLKSDNLARDCGCETPEGKLPKSAVSPLSILSSSFLPDKPYKTVDELISLLIERGLYIGDKQFAKEALSSLSYYDLINGYKNFFMRNDRFIKGTSIEELYDFRIFDLEMQNILIKYSMLVENRFKNILAQYLAKHCGVHQDEYLDNFHYAIGNKPKDKFDNTLKDIRDAYQKYMPDELHKIDQPTQHYVKRHNHIPPWILFKNVTFSSTIDLFSFLNGRAKQDISYELLGTRRPEIDYKLALGCLYTVRKFRNSIAHNLNFIGFRLNTRQAVSRNELENEFLGTLIKRDDSKDSAKGDPYSMILAMTLLLKESKLVSSLHNDIVQLMVRIPNEYGTVAKYVKFTHIPADFATRCQDFYNDKRLGPNPNEQANELQALIRECLPDHEEILRKLNAVKESKKADTTG